jgi:polyferredoxin
VTNERLFPWSIEAVRRGGLPAIALFGFHVIASRGFNAYVHFPPLDIPMHFLGGVVIAYFFHRASLAATSHGIIGPFHRVTHTVLVFALTCMATVFWEFAEFLSDHFFGTHAQLGLDDTLFDMLLGISGGIALLVVTSFAAARNESNSTNA